MKPLAASARALRDLWVARVYKPSHLKLVLKDYFDLRRAADNLHSTPEAMQAAMDWLCRAQDATPDGGVSARYRLDSGWMPSYPETTGYIIPTFFEYSAYSGKEHYRDRAQRMARWLLTLQLPSGAFPAHTLAQKPRPRVFNTGQIMLGLLRMLQEARYEQYLQSATRAGDWLVSVQEADGSWVQHTFYNRPHVYHTSVAWPLAELFRLTGNEKYHRAATKNLDWAISRQQANGWFAGNGFKEDSLPFLHTIAYTITGLIEASAALRCTSVTGCDFLAAAYSASEALLHRFEIRRRMAGQFDRNWKSPVQYGCLTGNAQMAYNWLRLYKLTGDARFLSGALKLNDYLKSTQDIRSASPGIRGGIKGSHPVWGAYIRYSFPNWAAKFFIDAHLMEERLMNQLQQEQQHHEDRLALQKLE